MNKLELKHLAAYLPYDLQVLNFFFYERGEKGKMTGLQKNHEHINVEYWTNRKHNHQELRYFKPILRPLSDLTKEIEHNGEKFVPFYRLVDFFRTIDNEDLDTTYVVNWEIRKLQRHESIYQVEYWLIEKLLEWHFDIHNLIEQGLAIDINILKNK